MSDDYTIEVYNVEANKFVTRTLTKEEVEVLKNYIARDATDTELKYFLTMARMKGLDPFVRGIHFVKRRFYDEDKKMYVPTFSIQIGIDGYRTIADRTGLLDGIITGHKYVDNELIGYCTVYRKDWSHPVYVEVSYKEYVQRDKQGNPTRFWRDMPVTMIEKVAEAHALRTAFAAYLSGIYTDEEMQQADDVNTVPIEPIEPENKNAEVHDPYKGILQEIEKTQTEEVKNKKKLYVLFMLEKFKKKKISELTQNEASRIESDLLVWNNVTVSGSKEFNDFLEKRQKLQNKDKNNNPQQTTETKQEKVDTKTNENTSPDNTSSDKEENVNQDTVSNLDLS